MGYLYQSFWPLLELARRGPDDPGLAVKLEALDDVEFDHDGLPTELLQVKHTVRSVAGFGDSSYAVWNTLGIWIEAIAELPPGEQVALSLVTTGVVPDGSAAFYLRDQTRDVDRALSLLETAARTSGNKSTQAARRAFFSLESESRRSLLDSIVVIDQEVHIHEIDSALKTALHWVIPPAHEQSFLDHLKGWWAARAVEMLAGRLPAFAATDLLLYVNDLRDQFGPENLPTDPNLPNPDDNTIAELAERPFVRQLELIAYTRPALAKAITDYYRAFTQRSRWLREELLGVGELDSYERRLVDEWEFAFTAMQSDLPDGATEDDLEASGRALLQRLAENAQARIRAQFNEPFITRGSLHALADTRRIGWHPDFEARLEALLGPVVDVK
jgi:hypothetical protein